MAEARRILLRVETLDHVQEKRHNAQYGKRDSDISDNISCVGHLLGALSGCLLGQPRKSKLLASGRAKCVARLGPALLGFLPWTQRVE